MSTADWALTVSLFSAGISLVSLWWNVWSKFIYPKARLHVSCAMTKIIKGHGENAKGVRLGAINHGPTEITVQMAIVRLKKPWYCRRYNYGLLNPVISFPDNMDTHGPYTGGLPRKVAVGEEFAVFLTPRHSSLANEKVDRIGFVDIFVITHPLATDSDL